jgi:type II secretory pathway pseudopilin PulG
MPGLARSDERGFTLVELLAASAIWIVICGALLYVVQTLLASARQIGDQQNAYIQLTHLTETWDAESSSAFAIFVPPGDVHGADNSDGHEVDFYSRDAAGAAHFWAYDWERTTSSLQRYTYATPGGAAVASDPAIAGITAFSAVRRPASAIQEPFLGGYVPRDVAVNFGYPGVDGGNAITELTVSNARTTFTMKLLPGTMPSGFQVVVASFTPAPKATSTPAPALTQSALYRITSYTSYTMYPCVHEGPTNTCTPYPINGEQCDVSYDKGASWTMLFWKVPTITSCP